ncbi:MAG: YceI family protein [Pseudomonadota bacterium]
MTRRLNSLALSLALACVTAVSACTDAADPSDAPRATEVELASPWTLASDASALTYLSIKSGNVAEVNTFGTLNGSVGEDGSAEISIDLDSVNTNVDIRNERMRNVFFETDAYPTATASTTLDLGTFADLEIGESADVVVRFDLALHGETAGYDIDAKVTRLGANRVSVDNTAPLILYPDDFNLLDGLGELQALAGLNSITPVVPVNVSLVFERAG